MLKINSLHRLLRLTAIFLQVVALQTFAQQTDNQEAQAPSEQKEEESELLEVITEEIVVIGSRAKPRSVTKSMVPVDVITSQDFSSQGDAEKKVTGGFFFRNPNTRGGVFSADGGRTLLIGDLLDLELTYSTFEGPCRSSLMPRPRPLTIAALPNFSRTASSAFSTLLSVDPMPPKSSPWTTWPASTRS